MLKNYYETFYNNNCEIVCIEIRCTNLGEKTESVNVYTADSDSNYLGTIFNTEVFAGETFTDFGKTIVGDGEYLVCESSGDISFKIGVNEDVL